MKKFLEMTFSFIQPKKEIERCQSLKNFYLSGRNFLVEHENTTCCSFLCTLSGGQDSVLSFFSVFLVLLGRLNFSNIIFFIEILYCHHFWQSKNFLTPQTLFRLSFLFEIPYTFAFSGESLKNENISRVWRMQIYLRVNFLVNKNHLILGQTKSDTLEKSFNNIFRGTTPNSFSQNKTTLQLQLRSIETFFSPIILKSFQNTLILKKRKKFTYFKNQINQKLKKRKKNQFQNRFLFKKKTILKKKYALIINQSNLFKNNKLMRNLQKKQNNSFWESFSRSEISQSYVFCFRVFESEIFRPLDQFTRPIIGKTVKNLEYPILIDKTNFSYFYSRNKMRHLFFPLIRECFNKKFETRIVNFFTLVAYEHENLMDCILELIFIFKLEQKFFSIQPISTLSQQKMFREKNIINFIFQQKMLVYRERTVSFAQLYYLQNNMFRKQIENH